LVCPLGSAIHELGHVIGFYHEMARTDRDLEINLYFNLMSSAEAAQYDIMPNPMPGYYGQPYDLGSIMHYRPTVSDSFFFQIKLYVEIIHFRMLCLLATVDVVFSWVNVMLYHFLIVN
jgi:hypothetical protein